jgi:capsular polysaccharide transport system ATP-binding protein
MDIGELTRFVIDTADVGRLMHIPVNTLPPIARQRLLYALGYAIPFGWYLFDGAIGAGTSDFIEKCKKLFAARRKQAGIVLTTASPQMARECCDSGAVLYEGRLTFFKDVEDAIAVFGQLSDQAEKGPAPGPAPDPADNDDEELRL